MEIKLDVLKTIIAGMSLWGYHGAKQAYIISCDAKNPSQGFTLSYKFFSPDGKPFGATIFPDGKLETLEEAIAFIALLEKGAL